MAEDLKNVRFSGRATEIADRICESGLFDDKIAVFKFALAYAIKHHFNEIDPISIEDVYDSNGSNYNIGSLDEDKYLSNLILSLYPDTTTPYRIVRVLMDFGMEKLGNLLDAGTLFPISANM